MKTNTFTLMDLSNEQLLKRNKIVNESLESAKNGSIEPFESIETYLQTKTKYRLCLILINYDCTVLADIILEDGKVFPARIKKDFYGDIVDSRDDDKRFVDFTL